MPSPVAHGIIGLSIALAWLVKPVRSMKSMLHAAAQHKRELLIVLVVALAPDIDYLCGIFYGNPNLLHQLYSHTIAWTSGLAILAWLIWRHNEPKAGLGVLLMLWVTATSHLIMDYTTKDLSYPYGIMILWPLSSGFFTSPVHIFPNMMKHSWHEVFQTHNLLVIIKEITITLPVLAAVAAWKLWQGKKTTAATKHKNDRST